jgi:hypothetical protein
MRRVAIKNGGLIALIPTVFDCCRPREDVLSASLSDYAAELRSVIAESGANEYSDPVRFFTNTYPTAGLRRLIEAAARRLSASGDAEGSTMRLDSSFGGGKTHGMIGLVHLARTPDAVPPDFLDPSLRPLKPAAVAAFDGEIANVVAGVDLEGGMRAKTPWGYIAYKLGGLRAYERIRLNDEQCSAPGVEDWVRIIGDRPTLILIDEIGEWLRKLRNKEDWKQLAPFLKSLMAAIDGRPDACLVISLAVGTGGRAVDAFIEENEYAAKAFGEAETVTARRTVPVNPTNPDETASVLTRRLFSNVDIGSAAEAIDSYARVWEAQKAHLPDGKFGIRRREALARSYPFHPDLIDTLNAKTATFQNFQRVRGMLRILAPTIRRLWDARPPDATAIHMHHIDIGVASIRTEFTTRLGQQAFDSAIAYDIANVDPLQPARAQRIDSQWYRDTAPFASYVARTIFVNSMAFNAELRGVSVEELRASMLAPGFPGGDTDGGASFVEDARKRFVEESGYLDDRATTVLRFSAEANLTVLIEQTKTNVDRTRVRETLRQEIETLFRAGNPSAPGFDSVTFPGGPGDVPDDANEGKPYLVVMGYEAETVDGDVISAPSLVARIAKHKGSDATGIRLNSNNVVFLTADRRKIGDMEEAVTRRLALVDLESRGAGALVEHQVRRLRELKTEALHRAAVAVQQAYRHVFFPSGQALDNSGLAHLVLETDNTAANPGDGQKAILRTLRDHQKISGPEDLPPNPIPVRDRTPLARLGYLSTRDLREEFRRDRSQPILLGDEPFRKLILAGVDRDVFVYGKGDVVFAKGLPPVGIEVSENAFVYTKRYADDEGVWPKRTSQQAPVKQDASVSAVASHQPDPADGGLPGIMRPSAREGAKTGSVGQQFPTQSTKTFEGPLREAFAQLRDAAGPNSVRAIVITTTAITDGAALIMYAPNLRGLTVETGATISYQPKDGSLCEVIFRGSASEARHVVEFAKPQLAAADDSVVQIMLKLTMAEPIGAQAIEKLGEELSAVCPGAIHLDASP